MQKPLLFLFQDSQGLDRWRPRADLVLFRVGFVGVVLTGLDQLGKSDLVGVGLEDKYKYPPPHDYPRAVSLTSNKIQTLANNT